MHIAIAIATASYMFSANLPMMALAQRISSGTDSYVLLAIPLFIFAGELMNKGGLTNRMVYICLRL